MGVSPRRLTGWEPREFHEHVYDGDRLVGVVVSREPEWSEVDRLAVVGELQRRRMLGSHGQPMDEATSPLGDPSSHDREYSYVAEQYVDFAQAALDTAANAYKKQYGDNVPDGLRWSVRKVTRA